MSLQKGRDLYSGSSFSHKGATAQRENLCAFYVPILLCGSKTVVPVEGLDASREFCGFDDKRSERTRVPFALLRGNCATKVQ